MLAESLLRPINALFRHYQNMALIEWQVRRAKMTD
jgi:hypothetical protein